MRAAVYVGAGGPEVIALRDLPEPDFGADDALVDVAYAGLNRADILDRMGVYGGGKRVDEVVPGLEFSGIVRAAGARVTNLSPGARVCGLIPGGAHAAVLATQAQTLALVPDAVSLQEAAAIPEAFLTAYDALFTLGGLGLGQTVLVHAIGSSVGLAAAALAKRAGAFVVGTSRTARKVERAREHGLDAGLLLEDGWPKAALDANGGRALDLVLDFIGAPTLEGDVAVLASRGRIVQIGTLGGQRATISLGAMMVKRISLINTVMKTRPLDERIELARVLERRLLPLFAHGALRATIDTVFPLAALADAHRAMEANANFGKLVIALDEHES
ncbi:MAG TPA: zinc-binding dehydrogenase [Candidatus Baltobacteraceae bacterium]|nr:zinc-binding dehydrogenase [Candidatus Baltobacteraceae bacterium]